MSRIFISVFALFLASEGGWGTSVLFSTPTAHAAPRSDSGDIKEFLGQKVGEIEVEGNKRIGKDAILLKLITKAGAPLTQEGVRSDVQALFGMGYFEEIEVRAERQNGQVRLIYVVQERPAISNIEFEGNERIDTSDLKEVIKIKEWTILDVNKVKEDVRLIQKHYEEKGYYLAKVDFEVKPVKQDEVELVYKVSDYDKVTIRRITFLNNKKFTDDQLKSVFQETREGSPFSFVTGTGNFKESTFKQDLQRLTYWYLDHGHVKFRYENPVVTVSDDKKWLYVSIYVDEGDQYKMEDLDFGGDLLFPKEELHEALTLVKGDVFSITERNTDIQVLTEKYQDLGYAFVNVVPKMKFNDEEKTLSVQYDFEKGNLVHFGEITVIGNTKTHDKVIRRELRIKEGELYSGSKLRQSRENVERLGYFSPGEVIFNTVSPKGRLDILNVEITVKERSTGTITLGAGYGSNSGPFITGQVSEINLMGRGQSLSFQMQLNKERTQRSFNLGFTEPYFLDTRLSTGGDLFLVQYPIPNKYQLRKFGFDVRLGYPIADFVYAYFTYKHEYTSLESNLSQEEIQALEIDADRGLLSSVVWSLVRDKRNNRFEPTGGNYQSASLETAGLGGDKQFVKWILNNRFYKRLIGDLVFRNSIEYGQIASIGDKVVPPAERFYLGGPNSLKGFFQFLVGPLRRNAQGNSIPEGGLVEMFSIFELEYPLIREAGLKLVTFFDAGNAFRRFPGTDGEPFTIRTDAGLGLRWFSPIGPLRFEWGFPLKPRPGVDDEYQFIFFIGPPF